MEHSWTVLTPFWLSSLKPDERLKALFNIVSTLTDLSYLSPYATGVFDKV